MRKTDTAALTRDEVATARSAIRVLRGIMAIGTALALPVALILALPLLSYALLAAIAFAPIIVGCLLLTTARAGRHEPRLTVV